MYSDTQVVLDHLGLDQPHVPPPPDEPFADLESVLALAEFENVSIKISGACTLAHRPFPYEHIWPPLLEILERYGVKRCLWGTDWTRAIRLLTYEQGVKAFTTTPHLSKSERADLMGLNLMRLYDWRPSKGRWGRSLPAGSG